LSTDFCLAQIPTPLGVPFEWGICVPGSCKSADVNNLFLNLIDASAELQIGKDIILD
jgi:hypothetical protein